MRICSFLPSATEIIYALNLEHDLFGVTHECDFPEEATLKPKLTSTKLASLESSVEIDRSVRKSLEEGSGIYELNFDALQKARPDIIFTQELCEVCAVSYGEIYRASEKLSSKPEVVSLDTFTLSDIFTAIETVGKKCSKQMEAERLVTSLKSRVNNVSKNCASKNIDWKPKLFFMEWIDPIMSSGHWIPELVEYVGAIDSLAEKGKNSKRVEWREVQKFSPDYLIISPCGFGVARTESEVEHLKKLGGWSDLPAVRNGKVFIADGNAYYSRPGPRIVDGLEILALMLHPELEGTFSKQYGKRDYKHYEFDV